VALHAFYEYYRIAKLREDSGIVLELNSHKAQRARMRAAKKQGELA
jgi:hypothetical protein